MTREQNALYLKMAFQCVGLAFTEKQIETIILTTDKVRNKKCRFSLMDAARILAEINTKYPPVKEPELFEELEQIEKERE